MKFLLLTLIFIIFELLVTSECKVKVISVTHGNQIRIMGNKIESPKILTKKSTIKMISNSRLRTSTRKMLTITTRKKTPKTTMRGFTKQPCEIYNIYNRIDPCYGARHE
jgi:hypothetical protein